MMDFGYSGLVGVLILAGDIWAIINIFQSSVSNEKKLLWILVVVLLPLLGLILWYFLGPRDGRVYSTLSAGDVFATLDMHIRFTRPAIVNSGNFTLEGSVNHRGRLLRVSCCNVDNAEGKRVALATS